ncbi:MAG: hypothetical protein KDH20_10985 [Rhodocyclaceae bacterium]|nr:hypothetical protein [Rhodocyclaceae bacterium]
MAAQDALETTELQDGPPLVRRVRSAPETMWSLSFDWDQDQWAVFDYFFQITLGAGAAWFDGLSLLGPAGLASYEAQIRGVPSHRYSDAFPARMTLTVATRARPTISQSTFEALTGG